jgi:hypothetical protein
VGARRSIVGVVLDGLKKRLQGLAKFFRSINEFKRVNDSMPMGFNDQRGLTLLHDFPRSQR